MVIMKPIFSNWLCVLVCLVTFLLNDFARAIYDPSATTTKPPIRRESILPWYLNGSNLSPPEDGSRSAKWSSQPDFEETHQQSAEPSWGDWREVTGSEIEQRSEIEAIFGREHTGPKFPSSGDQTWVDGFDHSSPYDVPTEIFDDAANLAVNRKNPTTKNTKYKPPVPAESPNLYEGVPVDSKKPRQEKIFVPFHSSRSSNVARYSEKSGVQCPNPSATGQFVYPPDCKFYVSCHQGRAYVQPCSPGTLFNPDTLECDFPHKVKCYGGEIADFPSSDYTEGNGQREPLVNSPRGHQRYGGGHQRVNTGNELRCLPQQTGYLAHPSDCTKFIQCDNGGTFIKDCGPGTVFNPAISVCDWPYNVNGCEDAFKKKNDEPPTILTPPQNLPHENYRTKPTWQSFPNSQESVKKIACPNGQSGLFPHPDTCKKFLQCANGVTYIMDCGPGTAFNPETSVCDWPNNVPGCAEDQSAQNRRTSERPVYQSNQDNWNRRTNGDRVVQGIPAGRYDQNGSPAQQQGGRLGPHQPGYHTGNADREREIDGQVGSHSPGYGHPTLDPMRPFHPIPTVKNTNGQDSGDKQYNYYDDHHNHDGPGSWNNQGHGHNHDGPGPWDGPGHGHNGPGSWDDSGHRHNGHDGPGPWNGPGHNHNHDGPGLSNGPGHNHNHDGPGPWNGPGRGHNHDGSGSWNRPGQDRPRVSDEEGLSRVSSNSNGNPNGWGNHPDYHNHRHDGTGPWNPSGHTRGENGDDSSQQPLSPDNNPNGWQPGNGERFGQPNDHRNGNIDRGNYGRTNPNFPGSDGRWIPSYATTTSRPSEIGWNDRNDNPTWNTERETGNRMKPSQPDNNRPGGFVPNSWDGRDWNQQPGQYNPKPFPTAPPKIVWTEGIQRENKSSQDQKLDDWLSKTNGMQSGDSRKDQDTKIDDWKTKSNIFNPQQENKRQGVKTITKDGTSGIYVNVNGTKGHYITREIEINQGHSNTKNYGKITTATPPKILNDNFNKPRDNVGTIDKNYPNQYDPIRTASTNNRWISTNIVNNTKPINDRYPKKVISTTEKSIFGYSRDKMYGRENSGIELPTVSIEDDRLSEKYNSNSGKINETIDFGDIVEPDIDKYEVDILDDKEKWKPKLIYENKTKKSNDDSVIMSINKKNIDVEILDVKLAPWSEDEPTFPVYYVAPVLPVDHQAKVTIMAPGSGQMLRLRGGSSPREGYLEVQGLHPGWGIVCDSRNGWSLNEAHVVCRQLGYTRGAEMAWQGRNQWDENDIPWIAATEVKCQGNETRFQTCSFVHGDQCQVKRHAVGIRCMSNRVAHCAKDEIAHDGQCYHLANPDSALNHDEAIDYCASRESQLIDITTQAENNFLSEWIIQTHPRVKSIMTSGIGFTTLNRTIWMWKDSSRAKFQFTKWWPGWTKDRKLPPWAGSRPVCIVLKKEFPCHNRPETNCPTDYFYWDVEDCASSMKGHSYVCERPYNDISCVYGKGQQYAGSANISASGKECLPWNDTSLVHALRVNVLNQEVRDKLMTHNNCRNPNPMKESRPWCFTGHHGERESCDIPACGKIGTKKSIASGQCKPKHFECMPGECIPSPWVCDGEEDCTNGLDERSCSSHLGFFKKTENHKLVGHDVEKWLDTPPKTCALRCKEADFTCRSFSHTSNGNICLLSDMNVETTGDLSYDDTFDYYEMTDRSTNCEGMFVCGNHKCINQSQVCDGKNNCGDRTDENTCSLENLEYEIRLAGSNETYEGRIEVKVFGHWGQVCDDGFGMIDANVVCKELGFDLGALEVRVGGYYGNFDPADRFMIDQLKCRGNESSLRECDFDGWGVHDCLPEEAVGVVCKSAVNTCQLGHWKCDNSPTCIPTHFICDEVVDCPDRSDENSAHCDAPFELRLANGSSSLEGRVEVRHHGVWGTICDDDFSQNAAKVICKSLGYGGDAIPKKNGFFGPGDGPIWLDEVFCNGSEAQLYKCDHSHWGHSNCDHDEDAGVICTEGSGTHSESDEHSTTRPEININDLLPSDCGKRAEDFGYINDGMFERVVHGSIAPKGSYPWQASIRVRGHSRSSHWCGAVVLSPLYVLTAAHCLEGYNKATYFIRAGDYNSEIDEGTEAEANIEDYYIHEEFRKGHRMNNDIALVLLKGSGIPLGEHVMPICLPPANAEYSPGLNCTISGFGSVENGRSAQSLNLRYGWVPLLDQSVCRADYVYGTERISDGMICAGFLDEGVDSCDGDSGGPLACLRNGAFHLYGLTSWGHHCGEANKPGVYVRIAYYRDWIEKKIRESIFGR